MVGEDGVPTAIFTSGAPLRLDVVFSTKGGPAFSLEIVLVGADRQKLALASLQGFHGATLPATAGVYKTRLEIEPLWLASGEYSVDVATSITNSGFDHYVEDACVLSGVELQSRQPGLGFQAKLWDWRLCAWVSAHTDFRAYSMIEDLISKLREQGAQIRLQGDRVVCDAPPNVMTPELVEQLREHKEQIVALLSKEAMAATTDEFAIPIISRKLEIPLSFAQESLWFLDQLEPEAAVYNTPLRLRLSVEVDERILQRSLNEIVRRHETLRTNFRNVSGRPIQVIEEAATLRLPLVDLTDVPEEVREAEADRLCQEQAERPFALGRDLMLRATLFRLEKDKHILLLNVHHIVFDAWSIELLLREIATLYEAFSKGHPSPLRELPVQYADFAAWQRGRLTGAVLARQLEYWRRQLDGAPPLLELPTEWPRPPVQTFRGSVETAAIPLSMTIALKALSQRAGVSLFMTLLAAFQTFLYRYSGQQDITVGSPITNRSRTELESLIGLFINTLPLRVDLSGNPTFRQLLSRVSEVVLGAYENQDVPFENLVESLQPARNLSYSPVFQVLFAVQNASPGPTNFDAQLDVISSATSKFDLSLYIKEFSDGMSAEVEYCTDLFGYETIRRMLKHFLVLLNGIVENPDEHVNSLPLLSVDEQQHFLVECNQTTVKYDGAQYLDKLFEEQAKATPDRVAVRYGDDLLTYRELDERADEVASHLRMLGVGQNELVGLCVERSLDMVVGLFGILKAGGAYLPLDPHYPRDRLAFMLEDARPIVVLTQRQLEGALPSANTKLIFIDELPQLDLRACCKCVDARSSAERPSLCNLYIWIYRVSEGCADRASVNREFFAFDAREARLDGE